LSALLARTLVFVTSAAVLVVEVLAVRLLAPYQGVSLETFTAIIGVILAGISLGAWMGGREADRRDPTTLLGPLLVGGGVSTALAPLVVDIAGPALSTDAASAVLVSVLSFLVPSALLAAVPPVVVKIRLASLDDTGSVVGSYSAIGTAGAIFGTFVAGFYLIGVFPTRPTVVAVGLTMGAVGAVMWTTRLVWKTIAVLLVGTIGVSVTLSASPCDHDTKYHCATVEVDPARESGRFLILDRLWNSYVDLEDPSYLRFRYIRLMADVIDVHSPSGSLEVLSIGGGGFTMPGHLARDRPGTRNIVLEIDPDLIGIGRSELALQSDVEVRVGDARIGVLDVSDDSIDVVVGDAYSGRSVPWHLTTVEYAREIERVLKPEGVYTINVIDRDARRFVRAEALTLTQVFSNVVLFAPPGYLSGDSGGNFVIVASQSPIDAVEIESRLRSRGSDEIGLQGADLTAFVADSFVLRDDFAPVDQVLGR